MTESKDFDGLRTVCPNDDPVTLGSVLGLPEVIAGRPEIIAGAEDLERLVRWTHVLESPKVQEHLRGGEIVLSTGVGWSELDCFERYVSDLRSVDATALILELGTFLRKAPDQLVEACRRLGFPLVILHAPVAFIAITEAIHRSLLAAQTMQLQAKQRVTEHFAELMRSGATLQTVLDHAAAMLQAPLVVEDPSFNLVFFSETPLLTTQHFARWQTRSRAEHAAGNPNRYSSRIEAQGTYFGAVICALPAQHPAGVDHVLTLTAAAIGSSLLTRDGRAHWQRGAQNELIQDLLDYRVGSQRLCATRFGATEFPVIDRALVGFTAQRKPHNRWPSSEMESVRELGQQHNIAIVLAEDPRNYGKLIGVLSIPHGQRHSSTLSLLASEVRRMSGTQLSFSFGSTVAQVEQVSESLREAIALGALHSAGDEISRFATAEPLTLLVHQLLHEPAIQALPERYLGALLSVDSERGSDYFEVLGAYLRHPTNRSRAANESHLSRSVFYQRLAAIEQLLDRDLNDAQNIAMLSVSLLVHRFNLALTGSS